MRAFQITTLTIACTVFSGCAIKPQVISSSPRTVVVKAGDLYVQESQNLADTECRKHSRFARLLDKPSPTSDQFVYDCVN